MATVKRVTVPPEPVTPEVFYDLRLTEDEAGMLMSLFGQFMAFSFTAPLYKALYDAYVTPVPVTIDVNETNFGLRVQAKRK